MSYEGKAFPSLRSRRLAPAYHLDRRQASPLPPLDRLGVEAAYGAGCSAAVVKAFRKRLQAIRAAVDERTFYGLVSFHLDRQKGARAHQHSMRLNDQWRLIVEFEGSSPDKTVVVLAIEDYH